MIEDIINKCISASHQMRIDVISATYNAGSTGAHIGGSLSLIEIMSVLYLYAMKYDPKDPSWSERDRLILSKGHGVLAQYAAMKYVGMISDDEFKTYKKNETFLYAHPSRNLERGVEFSSGSLGQGISLGVGVAAALKRKKSDSRVFVLVGDGECNEGSVWEALLSAAKFSLDNLTVIVDNNKLQYDGPTNEIMCMGNLKRKFEEFGFFSIEADGHDINEMINAFDQKCDRPKAIIADTVKGKGVSFMENSALWHNSRLSEKQYIAAMSEQGVIL